MITGIIICPEVTFTMIRVYILTKKALMEMEGFMMMMGNMSSQKYVNAQSVKLKRKIKMPSRSNSKHQNQLMKI